MVGLDDRRTTDGGSAILGSHTGQEGLPRRFLVTEPVAADEKIPRRLVGVRVDSKPVAPEAGGVVRFRFGMPDDLSRPGGTS